MTGKVGGPVDRQVLVHIDEDAVAPVPVRVGTAYINTRRGTTATTFSYDDDYQRTAAPQQRGAFDVSPDLPLARTLTHTPGLPGVLADCAPDRWGRNLIAKRIRAAAVAAGRTPPAVTEADFLLGVSDLSRQGSLRLAVPGVEQFVAADNEVPRLIDLPRLLDAADSVVRGTSDESSTDALRTLLEAGSASLGGARPKASVQDRDRLLIAKFPHPADDWDVMAWEKTALDLAARAAIGVPPSRLSRVGGRQVLLVDRFDRTPSGRRVGYVSGMTLLGATDGDASDYLELAESIGDHGSRVVADLAALWRRVAFSLAVNNVDDHPRNHGFLRNGAGWRLSPMFDVNPEPEDAAGRAMTVAWATGRTECMRALVDSARVFGLTAAAVRAVLDEVLVAVRGWRSVALANGILEPEVRRFEASFERGRALLGG